MPNWSRVRFADAYRVWIDSRVSISSATRKGYEKDYKRLAPFFAETPLGEIDIERIIAYRKARQKVSGSNSINKEINMLSQILARAGLWEPIAPWYERLPQGPSDVGMALEPDEEAYLFEVASRKPKWKCAYLASLLMRNTSMSFAELRMLTLANIDVQRFEWVRIKRGFKNRYRIRTIPCNADASWALQALFKRARKKGCLLPEHFLLPGRGPKPDVPMYAAPYKAWHALRKEAGEKYPRLLGVKFYDMRRTIATRMLENASINYNAVEAIMGHKLGSDTKRIYDFLHNDTLKKAVESVGSRRTRSSTG